MKGRDTIHPILKSSEPVLSIELISPLFPFILSIILVENSMPGWPDMTPEDPIFFISHVVLFRIGDSTVRW